MISMPEFKDFTFVWGLEDPINSVIPVFPGMMSYIMQQMNIFQRNQQFTESKLDGRKV